MYRKLRLLVLATLYRVPLTRAWAYRRLPRHRSGYQKHWVGEMGRKQRDTLEVRQGKTLQRFFPTPAGLERRVAAHNPRLVLDIGCGYGRFLEPLSRRFAAEGCDVAADLLERVPPALRDKVFHLDIANPPGGWVEAHRLKWDVSYAWAVYMYFIDDETSMANAMKNAEAITRTKIIIWDWKHVCDYMRKINPSDKFEYHYIPLIMG